MKHKDSANSAKTLDYELRAYENEITNGNNPVFYKGPRNFDQMRRINIRLNNIEAFMRVGDEHTKHVLGFDPYTSYGIGPNYSYKKIPERYFGTDCDSQHLPIFYSKAFLEELMRVPKYKLYPTSKQRGVPDYVKRKHGTGNLYHMFENFYGGIVCGQTVLFKEVVIYPTRKDFSAKLEEDSQFGYVQNYGSYEWKAIIGGKDGGILDIIRYDHNPNSHGNAFDSEGNILRDNVAVVGSHVHTRDYRYDVVFPCKMDSSDAVPVDSRGLQFLKGVMAVRNALGVVLSKPLATCYGLDTEAQEKLPICDIVKECYETHDAVPKEGEFIDRFRSNLAQLRENELSDEAIGIKPIIQGEKAGNEVAYEALGE